MNAFNLHTEAGLYQKYFVGGRKQIQKICSVICVHVVQLKLNKAIKNKSQKL